MVKCRYVGFRLQMRATDKSNNPSATRPRCVCEHTPLLLILPEYARTMFKRTPEHAYATHHGGRRECEGPKTAMHEQPHFLLRGILRWYITTHLRATANVQCLGMVDGFGQSECTACEGQIVSGPLWLLTMFA